MPPDMPGSEVATENVVPCTLSSKHFVDSLWFAEREECYIDVI